MSNGRFADFSVDELEAICGHIAKDASVFLEEDSPVLSLYTEAKDVLENKKELDELDLSDLDLGGCESGGCVL
ncbi:hypothetical protein [Vibrio phage BONAISHI]|nr:hypothetical protein [Vibrio phage BONAISHI]